MASVTLKIKIDLPGLRTELEQVVKEITRKLKPVGEIDIDVNADDAKKGLDGIEDGLEDVDDAGKKTQKTVKEIGVQMLKWIGIATLVREAFTFLLDSKNIARDADEVRSKFKVVFKEFTEESTLWAENFGNSVGRATTDVQKWMAGLQDTFVPLGFARDRSAQLSGELVKLAVDIASFNNAADEEVIRDFTSALVGNHETVRKYGILITEQSLKQEALNQGIEKNFSNLTELEKVQLRYNIILNSTTDAQGDAIRTADSLANVEKRQAADLKELQETLGDDLVPVMIEFNEILIEMVSLFIDVNNAVKEFTGEGVMGHLLTVLKNFNTLGLDVAKLGGWKEEMRKAKEETKSFALWLEQARKSITTTFAEQQKQFEKYSGFMIQTHSYIKTLTEEEKKRAKELAELLKTLVLTSQELSETVQNNIDEIIDRDIEAASREIELIGDIKIAGEKDIQRRRIDAMDDGKRRELAKLDFWLNQEMLKYKDVEINKQEVITAIQLQYAKKRAGIDEKFRLDEQRDLGSLTNEYSRHFSFLASAARTSTNERMSVANQAQQYFINLLQQKLAEFIGTKIVESAAHATAEVEKTTATTISSAEQTAVITGAMITQTALAEGTMITLAASSIAIMQAIAAAASSAATLVSIATFGGAALAGASSVASALALIKGLVLAGFGKGGFTGEGDPDDPAGVVHKGEHVFEADLVKKEPDKFAFLHALLREGVSLTDIFMGIARQVNPIIEAPVALAGINLSTPGIGATQQSTEPGMIKSLLSSIDNRLRKIEEKDLKADVNITGQTRIKNKDIYVAWKEGEKVINKTKAGS